MIFASIFLTVLAAAKAPAAKATTIPIQLPADLQNFQFNTLNKSPLALNHPWVTHTFATLFVVSAVALVGLLAVQTTKQEGLSGTIGGRVESAYRPRLGFDQQLARITTFTAYAFIFFALVMSIAGI